jgi:hypothetical protein
MEAFMEQNPQALRTLRFDQFSFLFYLSSHRKLQSANVLKISSKPLNASRPLRTPDDRKGQIEKWSLRIVMGHVAN